MTDEQMRIAIAESVGYKELFMDNGKSMVPQRWESPYDEFCYVAESLPDYLNDLNAMHEAESCFVGDASKAMTYAMHLLRACRLSIASEYDELNVDYCWHACHATTRQRAKAFLKTLNLWKD